MEKYKLFVQTDYNSKGHQQWFNFTVSNLQPDTCYELQIGPFKKKSSKFLEGMLPWICKVQPGQESGRKPDRPQYETSLASRIVSDVTYAVKKREEASSVSMSFLTFKLLIKRAEDIIHSPDDQLLIAYSQPYTYSRLLSLLAVHTRTKTAPWLNLKIGKLCSSLGGIATPLVTFAAKTNEAVLSAYQKPIIMISARVHPGEPPASFLAEGLLRALLSPRNAGTVERLLNIAEIHVVPMLNPDGVVVGNSRVSLGGVDMNRRWGADVLNPLVTPEVAVLKDYMKRFQN